MEGSANTTSRDIREEYDAFLGYHPSVPPLDVRLGLTSIPDASTPVPVAPLRWGILATGKVAHDFCQILKFLSRQRRHEISAVGSRSLSRAREFAKLHSIPNAHGSYSDLCTDPDVDVIYVASLHPDHRTHAEMALNGGKHVLVEKPMTMRAEDAEAIYRLGDRLGLFVGEGLWTRFFPAVEWARMRLEVGGGDDDDDVGVCRVVQADFSIDGDDVGPYPDDTIYSLEHGGGTAWTMGPYVVSAAMLPFRRSPDGIAANGILPGEDGVGELAVGMTLKFDSSTSDDARGGGGSIASCLVGYLGESSETTMYVGKRGRVTLWGPAHCPTSATLTRKNGGRGNGATSKSGNDVNAPNSTTTVEFPLPPSIPSIEESGGIRLPNSMGFIYEAEAVRRLISAGLRSFPQWTPEESVGCIRTIEKVLQHINK